MTDSCAVLGGGCEETGGDTSGEREANEHVLTHVFGGDFVAYLCDPAGQCYTDGRVWKGE